MSLPSKAASASNPCLKDKNEIDLLFAVLHKTWYLSYLLHQMPLLNLKSHPTMTILSLRT